MVIIMERDKYIIPLVAVTGIDGLSDFLTTSITGPEYLEDPEYNWNG